MGRVLEEAGKFEKISFSQFKKDWNSLYQDGEETIKEIYDNIKLPKRATRGSAGYDIYLPLDIHLNPKERIKIATGIRVQIKEGWVLQLYPRSSLGFKYGLKLSNTVGIIDSDYYGSDNEGHMFISIVNDNEEELSLNLEKGSAIVQGVFISFGIVEGDETVDIRNGGFGSTDK